VREPPFLQQRIFVIDKFTNFMTAMQFLAEIVLLLTGFVQMLALCVQRLANTMQ